MQQIDEIVPKKCNLISESPKGLPCTREIKKQCLIPYFKIDSCEKRVAYFIPEVAEIRVYVQEKC